MQWLEITLDTVHDRVDLLTGKLEELGVSGLITEDEADVNEYLESNRKFWDCVDDSFLAATRGVCRIKFYLEDSADGRSELSRIRSALPGESFSEKIVRDEDWENNWKEYYKPIAVGEKLLIVPQWEDTPEHGGRAVLKLDPGLIFGTGGHPTTQMCLMETEKLALRGVTALDLGCGSGILAIAAILLGADGAVGVDIDDKAPKVVMENAALNGIGADRLTVFAGDVLSDTALSRRLAGRKFPLVLANIVADVIIALSEKVPEFLTPDGTFVCSGIIDGREDEVAAALEHAGFVITSHRHMDNWHAFVCKMGGNKNV